MSNSANISRRNILHKGAVGLGSAAALTGLAAVAAPRSASAAVTPQAAVDSKTTGVAPVDSFAGANDDAKFAAALAYAKAQTYKPTIIFSNRAYTFTRTFPMDFKGLRISGPADGMEREFASTNRVKCPAGGLFSVVKGLKDFAIKGLSFVGSNNGRFIADTPLNASGAVLTDATITDCGFNGFSTLYKGAMLRTSIQRVYVNSLTSSALIVGGSDCWLFTDGPNFMSGQLPATTPYVDLVHLSQSEVGRVYVTPQGGYALRIQGSYGGLTVSGFMSDGTGRSGSTATQNQGLLITGGSGTKIKDFWCFNVNASKASKGEIVVTGGDHTHFESPTFAKSHGGWNAVNVSSPCIYTTVPIIVTTPITLGGHAATFQQSRSGLINLVGATGWTVVTKA